MNNVLMDIYVNCKFFQASSASAHGVGSASRGTINAISPTKTPIKTTTDDTPDFDRSKVNDEIFPVKHIF